MHKLTNCCKSAIRLVTIALLTIHFFSNGDVFAQKGQNFSNNRALASEIEKMLLKQIEEGDAAKLSSKDVINCKENHEKQNARAYNDCLRAAMYESDDAELKRLFAEVHYFGWANDLKGFEKAHANKLARYYYRKAASLNDTASKYALGVMMEKGEGGSADLEKSFKWFLSAAKDGMAAAQFNVANAFATGKGLSKPVLEQANYWYLRAARQGDAVAQYNIGNRYARGDIIADSTITSSGAESTLKLVTDNKESIQKSLKESYKWLKLAKMAGVEEAEQSLSAVSRKIGSKYRRQAEKEIKNWKPIVEEKRIDPFIGR